MRVSVNADFGRLTARVYVKLRLRGKGTIVDFRVLDKSNICRTNVVLIFIQFTGTAAFYSGRLPNEFTQIPTAR